MTLSFFTKRALYASKRLRLIARGLQVFGATAGVLVAKNAIDLMNLLDWPPEARQAYLQRNAFLAAGLCASFFLAGRALLQRQRSGAIGAAASIGLPLIYYGVMQAGYPYFPWYFDVVRIGVPLISLICIASIWRELGTVRESEIIDHGAEPESVVRRIFTKWGYGAPRGLPLPSIPDMSLPPTAVTRSPEAMLIRDAPRKSDQSF